MPKKTTLTDCQWEIVDLMRDGWELRSTPFAVYRGWIQWKKDLGEKWQKVNMKTINSLYGKGIIDGDGYPKCLWQLTELGKTLTREE